MKSCLYFLLSCASLKNPFSCAGVCSYEGRGGLCSIRLSEPLLKLRPRKDLVEVRWMVAPVLMLQNWFVYLSFVYVGLKIKIKKIHFFV